MRKAENHEKGNEVFELLIRLQGGWSPDPKNIFDCRGVYQNDVIWGHTWDVGGQIYKPEQIMPLNSMNDKQLMAELWFATRDARVNLECANLNEVALALLDKEAGKQGWQEGIKNYLRRMRSTFIYTAWQSRQFPDDGYGVKPPSTTASAGRWKV